MEDIINDALDNGVLTNEICNKVSHCKMVMVETGKGKRLLYVLYGHYLTTKHDDIETYKIMYC